MKMYKKGLAVAMVMGIIAFTPGCGILGQHSSTQTTTAVETSGSGQSKVNSTGGSSQTEAKTNTNSNSQSSQSSDTQTNTSQSASSNDSSSSGQGSVITDSNPNSTTQVKAPNQSVMGDVTAVRLINSSSGWIGGNGWIARTDNGGRSWHVQYVGSHTAQQIFALNGKDAWVVFQGDSAQVNGDLIEHTSDGGAHWTPVSHLPVNDAFLHFRSTSVALAANYYSNDGGRDWSKIPVPSHIVGQAYFHDRNNGWVVLNVANKVVVKQTVNGGKTWTTVLSRNSAAQVNNAVIRSAGEHDVWVELIGDSGMSQTSYSLFHSENGGANWTTVIANSTAGAGPAPGFPMNYNSGPNNAGSAPGPLYVVNPKVAFMAGYCGACDQSNTIGWTTNGGKTWTNSSVKFAGYEGSLIGMSDPNHGWWITKENAGPSVFYTTSNGGRTWVKVNSFMNSKENK